MSKNNIGSDKRIFNEYVWGSYMMLNNIKVFMGCIVLLGYLFISTLGSTSFFNPNSVLYALILGLIINNEKIQKEGN